MPRIILKNSSTFIHTNEVKIGQGAIDSCDSRLQHLGNFTLHPRQTQEVANADGITDIYWQHINAYRWIHKMVLGSEEETVIETSGTTNSNEPVDECQ
jgi:hypothetical protein